MGQRGCDWGDMRNPWERSLISIAYNMVKCRQFIALLRL